MHRALNDHERRILKMEKPEDNYQIYFFHDGKLWDGKEEIPFKNEAEFNEIERKNGIIFLNEDHPFQSVTA